MTFKMEFSENDFFNRLREILDEETQQWWASKISVAQGTISNCYKNRYLSADKIIKIATVKQVSPTWLIFGTGPKELKFFDKKKIGEIQDAYRNSQKKLTEIEYKNVKLRKKVRQLENALKQSALLSSAGEGESAIVGVMALLKMAIDVIFKMAEMQVKQNFDGDVYANILEWMSKNLENRKHTTAEMLEQLDTLFKPE